MIRVVMVADIRLYREGLAEMLGRSKAIAVVGVAATREAALAAVSKLGPDIVLLDTATADGVATARAVLAAAPNVKVVALGVEEVERDVLACAEAGVSGYVPRDASLDDLVAALESVARGEVLCSARVAAALLRRVAAIAARRDVELGAPRLTPREREIVEMVDRGLSNKEIARGLCIEVATVKNHVHNILEKLKVHRRGEAAARMRNRTEAWVAGSVS